VKRESLIDNSQSNELINKRKPWRLIVAVILDLLLAFTVVVILYAFGFPNEVIIRAGFFVFFSIALVIAVTIILSSLSFKKRRKRE
jgi:protein-S-isoprenylcysteine O-methyltransferase Ste14